MFHVYVAGVGSTLAAVSMGRTENVCEASLKPSYWIPLVHVLNVAASNAHSKRATPEPLSVPPKVNVADVMLAGLAGMLNSDVSGGAVSMMFIVTVAVDRIVSISRNSPSSCTLAAGLRFACS